MKKIFILTLLTILLLTGCSSTPPKMKSIFSKEKQAELRGIFNRHLADDNWDRYQQEWERFEQFANYDHDIDIRNAYDKDPIVLMCIIGMSDDEQMFQKELISFINKSMRENMNEEVDEGGLENSFK